MGPRLRGDDSVGSGDDSVFGGEAQHPWEDRVGATPRSQFPRVTPATSILYTSTTTRTLAMSLHPMHYWLAAAHSKHLSLRKLLLLLDYYQGNLTALFESSPEELRTLGLRTRESNAFTHVDWREVEMTLRWAEAADHHLISLDDDRYPPLLKTITDPPLVLYVLGNPRALLQQQIAVVGSRHATHSGLQNAKAFAQQLAAKGLAITSGLARGIDAAAHRGALVANGMTIAVIGSGLKRLYPPDHATLATQIVDMNGALLSEFSLQSHPAPWHFPRRNRLISGLSRGVLVVEAAPKSGSLISARHALEQGRDVYAIPGSIHQPLARGCHDLIKQGAKLVETAEDILVELGIHEVEPKKCTIPNASIYLTKDEAHLLAQIEHEITAIDVIISRSGLTAAEVSSILLSLELRELIQSVPGGYVRESVT